MVSVTYAIGTTLGGGGIGRIAARAAEGLHRAGYLSNAYTLNMGDVALPDRVIQTVPYGRYLDWLLPYYYNDMPFDLMTALRIDDPDVFHGWNNMCLRTMRRAAERGATTVVERASTHPTYQRRLLEREYEAYGVEESPMDERSHRRMVAELTEADAIVVPSEFVYESFLNEGMSEERLVTIPFGVDVETYHPPPDPTVRDGEFTALFVGALSLRKGVQHLLPAWQQADINGRLVFLGRIREEIEPIVDEYRDDPTIKFKGFVDDPVAEYQRASAFVFPSIEEGSALVSYEAMATGLPSVVTPNVGSLVEDGVHGHVVPPRDPDAIADAIEALAADQDGRRRMGAAARETVEPYTWRNYGDRVAAAHRDLIN